MKIDAVKSETIYGDKVVAWAVATIEKTELDMIYCEFDGFADSPAKGIFNKTSVKIAPYNTRTVGWEWRNKIKENERIDIFDTQGNWFLGTVLSKREIKKGDNTYIDFHVGYRIYSEDGTKIDNKGGKFEGWSEQYDEWIPAYSIRLQQ